MASKSPPAVVIKIFDYEPFPDKSFLCIRKFTPWLNFPLEWNKARWQTDRSIEFYQKKKLVLGAFSWPP